MNSVENNVTLCYMKKNISQPSLWGVFESGEEAQDDESRQQELVETLASWAIRNAYPELPGVVKSGRANWTVESWDLPRLEAIHEAADLFSQRMRADFALSHWAIMHGHPGVGEISEGLTSWVEWSKNASLEELRQMLQIVTEEEQSA